MKHNAVQEKRHRCEHHQQSKSNKRPHRRNGARSYNEEPSASDSDGYKANTSGKEEEELHIQKELERKAVKHDRQKYNDRTKTACNAFQQQG